MQKPVTREIERKGNGERLGQKKLLKYSTCELRRVLSLSIERLLQYLSKHDLFELLPTWHNVRITHMKTSSCQGRSNG